MKKQTKLAIILVAIFAILIAIMAFIGTNFLPETVEGQKTIEILVVTDENTESFEFTTTYEYLGEVLIEEELVLGSVGEFGLFITEVNGIKADDSLRQWWRISKDGVDTTTSADLTPIADGEQYELTLSTY